MNRRLPALLATSTLALCAVTGVSPASAQAAPGETSLAEVLTSDNNKFDGNAADFDIVTEAALAVLGAKPDSKVALIARHPRGVADPRGRQAHGRGRAAGLRRRGNV